MNQESKYPPYNQTGLHACPADGCGCIIADSDPICEMHRNQLPSTAKWKMGYALFTFGSWSEDYRRMIEEAVRDLRNSR